MNKPKLEIELVPSSAWYSNLRSILDKADWDSLRKLVYKKADYKCEICGGKGNQHPVECHEVWEYDSNTQIQNLAICQSLCPLCHEAKHIGFAQIKGHGDRAKETLMRVNGWNAKETEEYVREMFKQWTRRSKYMWNINIDKIKDYGIDLDKYKDKLKHS